jgi:hypothetical protein
MRAKVPATASAGIAACGQTTSLTVLQMARGRSKWRCPFRHTCAVDWRVAFTRMGVASAHNEHHWAHENRHFTRERASGMLVPQCVGRYTRRFYHKSIISYLNALLPRHTTRPSTKHVQYCWRTFLWPPENTSGTSPSPHYGRRVRNLIHNNLHHRWISRVGPIHWSSWSPDLNPITFKNDVLQNVREFIVWRANKCTEAGGGLLGHLL